MVKLLTWNCNGLADNRKGSYIGSEYNKLQQVDIALFIEMHAIDNEKICQDIKDFVITDKVIHSFRSENNTYAGLTFVISKNYEVTVQHEKGERKNLSNQVRVNANVRFKVQYCRLLWIPVRLFDSTKK